MRFAIVVRPNFELRLRTEADAESIFNIVHKNRAHLRQWLPWVDYNTTADDTRQFIQSCSQQFDKQEGLDLGIWYANQWIGSIGFHDWDKTNRKAALGYWLSEEFQGKGLMTDAAQAMVKYGFDKMHLNRIEIRCATGNVKSQAIPKRLHFKKEGVTRQSEWLYDHFEDMIIYSLLAEEYP